MWWPVLRVGGFVLAAPIASEGVVPGLVKIVLTLALALLALPKVTVTCWKPREVSIPSSIPSVFFCASVSSGLCLAAVSIFCWARM